MSQSLLLVDNKGTYTISIYTTLPILLSTMNLYEKYIMQGNFSSNVGLN